MKRRTLLLLSALVLTGCRSIDVKVPSLGSPYEMFVIAPTELWEGAVGDSLRTYLAEDVEMINQPEPRFTLYSMPPTGFKETANKHRNILILRSGEQYAKSDMTARYDANAKPQLEVTITSPSADSLAAFLHRYGNELVRLFEITERDRFSERAEQFKDVKISTLIQDKFGFKISIPQGYQVRLDTTNFLWISYEWPLASVGFTIYTYPADSVAARNETAGNIMAARNAAVMQVPGPSEGSYMTTSNVFLPDQKLLTVHGRRWMQVRGFWDVRGDFMGGPFINYTTYDAARGRMVAIDGYVYSPSPNNKVPMRNYVRQIEAIFMTARVSE